MRQHVPYGAEPRELRVGRSPIGGWWPVVYGRTRVSCPLIHLHVRSGMLLELVAVVSLGEIDAIETIHVEAEEVYPSRKAWCQVEVFTGTLSQERSSLISHTSWYTSLAGVAYIALVLDLSQAPTGGLPDVSAVVRGRKCGPNGTYTTSPVWHLYDLITNSLYGAKLPVIDSDWSSAAGVTSLASSLVVATGGQVTVDDEVIRALLQVIHGRLWWDGRVRLSLDNQAQNVGIIGLDGPIRVLEDPTITTSIYEAPNSARARYIDSTTWQERQVSVQTLDAQRGIERPRWLECGLLPVGTYQDAMRVVTTALVRGRAAARSITLICDGTAWDCVPGTRVTSQLSPIAGRELLITDRTERDDGTIRLTAIPWSPGDFDAGTYVAPTDSEPTTATTADLVLLQDDFISGLGTSGTIGELGWAISGTCIVSYPAVTGRYGVLGLLTTGNTSDYLYLSSVSPTPPYSVTVIARSTSYGARPIVMCGVQIYWAAGTTYVVSGTTTVASLSVPTGNWWRADVSLISSGNNTLISARIESGSSVATGTLQAAGTVTGQLRISEESANSGAQFDLICVAMERP